MRLSAGIPRVVEVGGRTDQGSKANAKANETGAVCCQGLRAEIGAVQVVKAVPIRPVRHVTAISTLGFAVVLWTDVWTMRSEPASRNNQG
jgi:hypothetical protein